MPLYLQLLKTEGYFVTRKNHPYVKVVETKGHFVAKAILGKLSSATSFCSPTLANNSINIQR